jgi:hypothetical protein
MTLAAGYAGQSTREVGPMAFHTRIDVFLAGSRMFCEHPIRRMFSRIGIKGRLIGCRSASGKGHESDKQQETVLSSSHYL